MNTYSLGFSPCPNDTYIFYALVNGMLKKTSAFYRESLKDVETLNRMAMRSILDITKLSYHALGHVLNSYILLSSGSALGRSCGPLLVTRAPINPLNLKSCRVAIPGRYTTAALLLRLYSEFDHLVEMSFEKIMPAIKTGEVQAGVIIHEGRFTYKKYGLTEIIDLGRWWEEQTGLPIPLGGIAAKRDLGRAALAGIDADIRSSLEFSMEHPGSASDYVRIHAQEMENDVLEKHISLYVNEFSINLGADGIKAVDCLLKMGYDKGIFPVYRPDFVIGL